MGRLSSTLNNEQGAVIVITLLIMVLCTLVGIAAVTTTTIEEQIAGNDRLQKLAFYNCDGGTELGHELLEQNTEEYGFTANAADGGAIINNKVYVAPGSLDFWANADLGGAAAIPSDTNRDICFPPPGNIAAGAPHTNVNVTAIAKPPVLGGSDGEGMEYESDGKSKAVNYIYEICSQHQGMNNSVARIRVQWRHVH